MTLTLIYCLSSYFTRFWFSLIYWKPDASRVSTKFYATRKTLKSPVMISLWGYRKSKNSKKKKGSIQLLSIHFDFHCVFFHSGGLNLETINIDFSDRRIMYSIFKRGTPNQCRRFQQFLESWGYSIAQSQPTNSISWEWSVTSIVNTNWLRFQQQTSS